MPLRILFFAAARDAAGGISEAELSLPDDPTVGGLRAALGDRWPRLGEILPRCRLAVNEAFAAEGDPLRDGDEVAIIPPVAGG